MNRYQVVKHTGLKSDYIPEFAVYEVEVDPQDPHRIIGTTDIMPVELGASTLRELKQMIEIIYQDIATYGVVTSNELEEAMMLNIDEVEILDIDDSEYDDGVYTTTRTPRYTDEEDDTYHSDIAYGDKVIDAVDFFKRQR